jgi:TonB-linked SusC/RagA family outer membrane protein
MKLILRAFLLNLMLSVGLFAQDIIIEGTIRDGASGETLPGANVIAVGSQVGVVADFDGNYSITVPQRVEQLEFSFMGMTNQIIDIKGRVRIDIDLVPDSKVLNDVIVVAYGTTTKEAFTGAAEVVSSETIEDRPVTSFEKSLQGTTAGLQVTNSSGQPGSAATVRIRGVGSLSAGSAPLYIIDGVPMSGSISDINPSDIESLTILKDAAAASLYGSRAANGVIMIVTKQGKAGQTKISFNAQSGVSSRVSDGYELMNSTQFYEHTYQGLFNEALLDGQSVDEARAYAQGDVEEIVGFNPFGVENPLDENGKLIPGTKVNTNTDWRDEVYKTGIIQNYNLNVSGGNENTKVFFSLGYFNDSGTTLSSDFTRYSGKLNVSHKVNKFISTGMSTHFSSSITNAPPGGSAGANPVRSAEIINAASPVYNNDGTYNWDNKAVFDFNPVGLSELDKYEYKTKRAILNAYINVQLLPSLSFRTTGAVDYSADEGLEYYNPFHGNGAGVNGRSSQARSSNSAWNISNILSWNQNYDDSNIEVLVGQEAHAELYSVLSAGVTDFSVPGNTDLVWGSQPSTPSSYSSDWSMVSYLGQAKYNYASKYYASASVRTDGSSRFGEENKYGVFYSFGASWRLTQEDFLSDISWLDNLKLRASYGTSGNNNIGNYASLGLYGSGANYSSYPGLTPIQPSNSALRWEKITSSNIGVETKFFNRLDISLEYYVRQSDGLLFAKPLSAGKGFGSVLTNLGAMKNSGLELTANYDIFRDSEFEYNIGFNISTNKNEIRNLSTDQIISGSKLLEVGGDVYQFYMREWAGVNPENGTPMWYTNEMSDDDMSDSAPASGYEDPLESGRMVTSDYSDAERVRMGSAMPEFYGGLTNAMSYKNFDLNFYFYFSVGGQVYNYDYAANMHDGVSPSNNLSVDALDAWTPNNKYTNVPRYVKNNLDQSNQMSSRFLEDASYLRLKNISLGYNFSSSTLNKLNIQRLRLYVSGENLFTLSNYKGFDPEGAISGTTSNSIPGTKVTSFGLKLDL